MSADAERPPASERAEERDFDVTRLGLGDFIAVVAAFALLFIMAGDWYSTAEGERARGIVEREGSEERGAGLIDEGAAEDARVAAEQAERNAWNIASPFDLVVLAGLLATIACAIAAAALVAAGRAPPDPRRSPSMLAALLALLALVFVAIQAALRLDPDSNATTEIGLPLGVAALGAIAFGAAFAVRERERADETAGEASAGSEPGPGAPGASAGRAYNRTR